MEIESSEDADKDELIQELLGIVEEKYHPSECDETLLNNLLETINGEKKRITEDDILKDSLQGKDEIEQARIIAEMNRRKIKK